MMKLQSPLLLTLAAFCIGVVGCSDDTTGPGTNDPTVVPKQGSTYTYAEYQTDASGQKKTGTDSTYTITVTNANLSIGGKSNVVMMVQSGTADNDTTYLAYEANGDVSIYFPIEENDVNLNTWLTLPFGSRSEKKVTVIDTTIQGSTMKIVATTKGTGSEESMVGSEKMNTYKAEMKLEFNISLFGAPITSTTTTTYWFAPKIGNMVKQTVTATALGIAADGSVTTLTGYTLK